MTSDDRFDAWVQSLEQRHTADLRVQEVTRALRALSSVYVERRDALKRGKALDSAGKRAAFALFYGPLHYLVTREIVTAVGAAQPTMTSVLDLGCGTGAVGAAWASALSEGQRTARRPEHAQGAAASGPGAFRVVGFDRHPWAVAEACWTYRALGLAGTARRMDLRDVRFQAGPSAVVAGFTVNELGDDVRASLLQRLLKAAADGCRVLVIEPIAKPTGDWWGQWAASFQRAGGREDSWRCEVELPQFVRTLDRAAGLDHRVLTARSLYLSGDCPDFPTSGLPDFKNHELRNLRHGRRPR